MNQTPEREALVANVTAAAAALTQANAALIAFDARPDNNVFPDMETAEARIEDALRGEAEADCEGSHNCGMPQYHRHFIVDGVEYVGTLSVEYNRHDKTYYYVEEASFTYSKAEAPIAA